MRVKATHPYGIREILFLGHVLEECTQALLPTTHSTRSYGPSATMTLVIIILFSPETGCIMQTPHPVCVRFSRRLFSFFSPHCCAWCSSRGCFEGFHRKQIQRPDPPLSAGAGGCSTPPVGRGQHKDHCKTHRIRQDCDQEGIERYDSTDRSFNRFDS